jgi:hypothetical protein
MAVEDRLDKLDSILGTVNSGYESQARMMAKAQLQEEAFIKKLAQLHKLTEQEIKAKLDLIETQKKQQKYEEDREKAIAEGIKKVLGGLHQFASGAIDSSQAIYTSDKAFTSVIPTMNLLGNAIKSITGALSSMFSGIPFLGAAIAGVDKITSVAIDMSLQVGKMMMENSQALVDNYNNLSKVGVTFGGNLTEMGKAAHAGGMSIAQYSKFVTENVEGLSTLGGTIQQATNRVMAMGREARNNEKGLLVMYGSFEAVNGAAAQYAELAAKAGIDTVKNYQFLEKGSGAYLVTLKEMTAITGMTAAQQKKEIEERLKHAATQATINRLSAEDARNGTNYAENLKNQILIAKSMMGDDFADIVEEIAVNGTVISQAGLEANAQSNGLFVKMAQEMVAATRNTKEQFYQSTAEVLKGNESALKQFTDQGANVSRLAFATQNEYVSRLNKNTSQIVSATDKRVNLEGSTLKELAEQDKKRKSGTDKATTEYDALLESIQKFKKRMDEITVESLPKMANIATRMVDFNETLVTKFGPTFGDAVDKFSGVILELVEKLTGKKPQTAEEIRAAERTRLANQEVRAAQDAATVAGPDPAAQREAAARKAKARREQDEALANEARAYREARKKEAAQKMAGSTKPLEVAELSPLGSMTTNYEGLTDLLRGSKPGEATAGGAAEQRLVEVVKRIRSMPGLHINAINALNDKWHQDNNKNSKHTQGKAADLNIAEFNDPRTRDATLAAINQILNGLAKAEAHPNASGNGEHVHVELMKKGGRLGAGELGIVGEAGAELISGPAQVTGVNETARLFATMIEKMEELVKVNKDQASELEKIYRVSA